MPKAEGAVVGVSEHSGWAILVTAAIVEGMPVVVDRRRVPLIDKGKLSKMWVLRRILMQMGTIDAMEFLLDKMKDSKTNEDFFDSMNQ